MVGCANKAETNVPELIVQKHVDVGEGFEPFREVRESEKVETVKELIGDVNWQQGNPSWVRPPDYQFYFDGEKEKYYVWLTPKKDQLEIEVRDQPKFTKLTPDKSEILYEIMAGKQLTK